MAKPLHRDDSLAAMLDDAPPELLAAVEVIGERRADAILHGRAAAHSTLRELLTAAYVAGVTDCAQATAPPAGPRTGET